MIISTKYDCARRIYTQPKSINMCRVRGKRTRNSARPSRASLILLVGAHSKIHSGHNILMKSPAPTISTPLEAQGVSGRCLAIFPAYLVSEASSRNCHEGCLGRPIRVSSPLSVWKRRSRGQRYSVELYSETFVSALLPRGLFTMEWASRTHRFAFTSIDLQSRPTDGLEAFASRKKLNGSRKRGFSFADMLVKVQIERWEIHGSLWELRRRMVESRMASYGLQLEKGGGCDVIKRKFGERRLEQQSASPTISHVPADSDSLVLHLPHPMFEIPPVLRVPTPP